MAKSRWIPLADCEAGELLALRLGDGYVDFQWAIHGQPLGSYPDYDEVRLMSGVDQHRVRDAGLKGLARLLRNPALVLGRNFSEERCSNLAWCVSDECGRIADDMPPSREGPVLVGEVWSALNAFKSSSWDLESWSDRNWAVLHYQQLIPLLRKEVADRGETQSGGSPERSSDVGRAFHHLDLLIGRSLEPKEDYTFTLQDEWLVSDVVAQVDFLGGSSWPHPLPAPDAEMFRLAYLVAYFSPSRGRLQVEPGYSKGDTPMTWALHQGETPTID